MDPQHAASCDAGNTDTLPGPVKPFPRPHRVGPGVSCVDIWWGPGLPSGRTVATALKGASWTASQSHTWTPSRKSSRSAASSESELFEYFAAFCIVSSTYEEEFDTADVQVGGEDDLGLDALAIIINGVLVTSVEEAEDGHP